MNWDYTERQCRYEKDSVLSLNRDLMFIEAARNHKTRTENIIR